MPLGRTGVVIGLIISLIVVTLQNRTPTISLVFLGMRSQPLPLGLWIVGAVVMGILIGLALLFILNLGSRNIQTRSSRRRPAPSRPTNDRRSASASVDSSDWDTAASSDWGDSTSDWSSSAPRSTPTRPASPPPDATSIDEQRYARAGEAVSPPSGTYSRSAQDPEFSGQSGQRESVFEAEYRMVSPPSQSQQEDWEELEDDFFERD